MFKAITLKRMESVAQTMVEMNMDLFEKYRAEVTIRSKGNHVSIMEINSVEHIIPFGILCSYKTDVNGVRELSSVQHVSLCMNSIYKIAKARNEKPMDMLDNVLDSLFDSLKTGIYHREITVPNTVPFKKETVVA
jgi:hypothetical protein